MIPLKIGEIKTTIPTSWNEVTLGQYIDLQNYKEDLNMLRLLSILTGVEYRKLLNVNAESFDDRIMDSMEFIQKPIDIYTLEKEDVIEINKKKIAIPDPSVCTIGQKLTLQSKIRQLQETGEGSHSILVSYAIAIYLQPQIDGVKDFDDSRIEAVRNDVMTLPLVKAYPCGTFLLDGWLTYLKSSGSISQASHPNLKSGLGLPAYSLNIMSSTLLSSWLAMILPSLNQC